jgi:ribosome-associated protein
MSTRKSPRPKKSTPSTGSKPAPKAAGGKASGARAARGGSGAKGAGPGSGAPKKAAPKSAATTKAATKKVPAKKPGARAGKVAEATVVEAAPEMLAPAAGPGPGPGPGAPPAKRAGRAPTREEADATRKFAIEVARLAHDDKCADVVLLDVRTMTSVSDYIVIGSGTSERQMRSVLDHVEELGAKMGVTAFRRSVDERSTWILLDFVDVVVHLFEPNTRAHYDLEMMWGDAPRLEWERPDQVSRDRAGLGLGAGA